MFIRKLEQKTVTEVFLSHLEYVQSTNNLRVLISFRNDKGCFSNDRFTINRDTPPVHPYSHLSTIACYTQQTETICYKP